MELRYGGLGFIMVMEKRNQTCSKYIGGAVVVMVAGAKHHLAFRMELKHI